MLPFVLALALLNPQPWVPAENGEGCGPTAHRHSLDLKENGQFVVNKQKGELDIVFDGECHNNDTEVVCKPTNTSQGVSTCQDSKRKVLPVPKFYELR
jgi:hypothetical protein